MTTENLACNDLIFENDIAPQQIQVQENRQHVQTETHYYELIIRMVGLCLHEMTKV